MRRVVRGVLAAVALNAVPAIAAELVNGRDGAPLEGYSWTGGYFGVNSGYDWGRVTNSSIRPAGASGGAQAGYSWQSGQFVFGGETDLQLSAAEDTFAAWKFSNPWFGSVRGRAGFAMNHMLFYATAGLAYSGLRAQVVPVTEAKRSVGYTAGAGMEVGLTRKWTARAEYLFMDMADRGYVLTGTGNGLEAGRVRFGVNYRF